MSVNGVYLLEIQSRTIECPIEVIVAVLLGIAGGLA
jgi:hypothetical protein